MRNLFRTTALAAAFTLGVIGFGGSAKAEDNLAPAPLTIGPNSVKSAISVVFDRKGNVIAIKCYLTGGTLTFPPVKFSIMQLVPDSTTQWEFLRLLVQYSTNDQKGCPSGTILLRKGNAALDDIQELLDMRDAVLDTNKSN